MGPLDSTDKKVLELANEWIREHDPIHVDVYMPHSAGTGITYLISELPQFESLIEEASIGSVITVFKSNFILHGYFDEQMRTDFQNNFSEGEGWWVLEGTFYPEQAEILASGSHWNEIEVELMDEPQRLKNVFIGIEPDIPKYWIENIDENILIIRKK